MWTLLLMLHLCKLWGKKEEIQEQLQTTQNEVEEKRRKRESVESKLMEVKNQLEEERKNREVMEARLVRDQNLLKEGLMAPVSHMQSFKNGIPAAIFSIFTNSASSDEASSSNLMDDNWGNNTVSFGQKRSNKKIYAPSLDQSI